MPKATVTHEEVEAQSTVTNAEMQAEAVALGTENKSADPKPAMQIVIKFADANWQKVIARGAQYKDGDGNVLGPNKLVKDMLFDQWTELDSSAEPKARAPKGAVKQTIADKINPAATKGLNAKGKADATNAAMMAMINSDPTIKAAFEAALAQAAQAILAQSTAK